MDKVCPFTDEEIKAQKGQETYPRLCRCFWFQSSEFLVPPSLDEEPGQEVVGEWVCRGDVHTRDKLPLHHNIAGPKLCGPDFICIPFIPKYHGLRSYSPPQYSINFLGHNISGQDYSCDPIQTIVHVSGNEAQRREGIFPKSHSKVVVKVRQESRQRKIPSGWLKTWVQDSSSPGSCAEESLAWHPPGSCWWQKLENLIEELWGGLNSKT